METAATGSRNPLSLFISQSIVEVYGGSVWSNLSCWFYIFLGLVRFLLCWVEGRSVVIKYSGLNQDLPIAEEGGWQAFQVRAGSGWNRGLSEKCVSEEKVLI